MLLPASHLLLNSRKNLSSGNCLVSTLRSSMMSIIVRVCCFLQDFAFHLAAAWRETQTELLIPWLGIFFSFRWANMCFGFKVFTRHQYQQQTEHKWAKALGCISFCCWLNHVCQLSNLSEHLHIFPSVEHTFWWFRIISDYYNCKWIKLLCGANWYYSHF